MDATVSWLRWAFAWARYAAALAVWLVRLAIWALEVPAWWLRRFAFAAGLIDECELMHPGRVHVPDTITSERWAA